MESVRSTLMTTSQYKKAAAAAILLCALCQSPGVSGAQILCVFQDPSISHMNVYEPLTRELVARGHQLTVISLYPQKKSSANYTDIVISGRHLGIDRFFSSVYALQTTLGTLRSLSVWWQQMHDVCTTFLGDPQVQSLIHSDHHFDLVVVDVLLYECFLGFVHRFQAPLVLVSANRGTHWMWDLIGATSPLAYVPSYLFGYTDRMSLRQRLVNVLEPLSQIVTKAIFFTPYLDYFTKKYFNDTSMPHVNVLAQGVSLLMTTSHTSMDYPRPLVPNIVFFGGIHNKPPKKSPPHLQKFLDEAQHGAVFFSLGSTVSARLIPPELRDTFVQAFSRLKQRVLWVWDGEEIADLPSNVHTSRWLPQMDILAHPKVLVFVSQGGYISMQESVYHGVPILGIPLYGEQYWNVKFAEEMGFGFTLDLFNISRDALVWAIHEVTHDRYQKRARQVSVKYRDNLQPPLEKAVYWVEYVIRHKGAPHLRVASLDLSWYQYFMLDVLSVTLAVFSVFGLIFHKLATRLFQIIHADKMMVKGKLISRVIE